MKVVIDVTKTKVNIVEPNSSINAKLSEKGEIYELVYKEGKHVNIKVIFVNNLLHSAHKNTKDESINLMYDTEGNLTQVKFNSKIIEGGQDNPIFTEYEQAAATQQFKDEYKEIFNKVNTVIKLFLP
jgi:hypothetical protein